MSHRKELIRRFQDGPGLGPKTRAFIDRLDDDGCEAFIAAMEESSVFVEEEPLFADDAEVGTAVDELCRIFGGKLIPRNKDTGVLSVSTDAAMCLDVFIEGLYQEGLSTPEIAEGFAALADVELLAAFNILQNAAVDGIEGEG